MLRYSPQLRSEYNVRQSIFHLLCLQYRRFSTHNFFRRFLSMRGVVYEHRQSRVYDACPSQAVSEVSPALATR